MQLINSSDLEITDGMMEVMYSAAKRRHPAEACGVIAGGHCYELTNHAIGSGHFEIRAEDIRRVADHHGGYDAVWHSHPSGRTDPSRTDWAYHPVGKALVIVAGEQVVVHTAEDFHA